MKTVAAYVIFYWAIAAFSVQARDEERCCNTKYDLGLMGNERIEPECAELEQSPQGNMKASETLISQTTEIFVKNTAPLSPAIVKKINQSIPLCIGVNTKGSTAESQKQNSFEIIPIDPLGYVANSLVGLGVKPSTTMFVQVLKGPSHGTAILKVYQRASPF
jgi:hypothetical protein